MHAYFLTTERIGFSRWSGEDYELAAALWGEPEVTRLICASGVFTERDIRNRLDTEIRNFEAHGMQYFPLFQLEDGDLIGCCGLRPYGDQTDVLELGFHLRKEYWGRGLGYEAASAAVKYGFSVLGASALAAGRHPQNAASKRLLEKLGFLYAGDEYYAPTGLYHPTYRLLPGPPPDPAF